MKTLIELYDGELMPYGTVRGRKKALSRIVQVTEDTVTFETGEDRVRIQIKKWGVSTTAKLEAEEAAATKKRR